MVSVCSACGAPSKTLLHVHIDCLWYLKSYVVKQGSAAAAHARSAKGSPLALERQYNASAPAGAMT